LNLLPTFQGEGGKTARLSFALLLVAAFILVGCGSTATTSPAEAKAVAAVEGRFLDEWTHAYRLGLARCKGLTEEAGLKCLHRVESPLRVAAMERFAKSSEALLDDGLGPKCAASLKDARDSMVSISSFAGSTTFTCRAESRKAS
jgi:hypothetical protein